MLLLGSFADVLLLLRRRLPVLFLLLSMFLLRSFADLLLLLSFLMLTLSCGTSI
jgi:hypothetical protein